jgi:hypothetical protein
MTSFASSRIPPEIWLEIFDYATGCVPRLLDIDVPDPLECPSDMPFTDYYDLDLVRLSLRTKLSLVLVCRSWHNIAIDLLHQVLLFDSLDTCRTLHNNFETSWATGVGPHVRHVLLGTLDRKAYRYLPSIFRKLSNVKILSLWNATVALSDERTADVMASMFGPSLRKLHVYAEQLTGQPLVTLYDLVHSATRLRTLIVDCKDIQGAIVLPQLPELTFVSGHNLILDNSYGRTLSALPPGTDLNSSNLSCNIPQTSSEPFPRLKHMLFPARRLFSRAHSRAFDALSPFATHATVDLRRDWEVGPEHDLWAGLSTLWSRCPGLTHVQLILAWQQFAAADRFPPQLGVCPFLLPTGLTHLSVLATFTGSFRMQVFVPCLESLLGALERVGRTHPSLRVVRFVSPRLVERVRQAVVEAEFAFVKALHDRCNKLFRLEDHEGNSLLLPSNPISVTA